MESEEQNLLLKKDDKDDKDDRRFHRFHWFFFVQLTALLLFFTFAVVFTSTIKKEIIATDKSISFENYNWFSFALDFSGSPQSIYAQLINYSSLICLTIVIGIVYVIYCREDFIYKKITTTLLILFQILFLLIIIYNVWINSLINKSIVSDKVKSGFTSYMGCVTGFGGLFLIAFVLLFTTHYSLMNTRKVKNIAELQDQLEKIKNEKNIEDTELENIKK